MIMQLVSRQGGWCGVCMWHTSFETWLVPGSHFEGGFISWGCFLSLSIAALKCSNLSYQQARAMGMSAWTALHVSAWKVNFCSKCMYLHSFVLLGAQLCRKCVCVCVHSSHRDIVLSQYAAIFSVSATIQPRERCALKIMFSLQHLSIYPSCSKWFVCVCTVHVGKESKGKYRK